MIPTTPTGSLWRAFRPAGPFSSSSLSFAPMVLCNGRTAATTPILRPVVVLVMSTSTGRTRTQIALLHKVRNENDSQSGLGDHFENHSHFYRRRELFLDYASG